MRPFCFVTVIIARNRPLLSRKKRNGAFLIVDSRATDIGALDPLSHIVGKTHGVIGGLFAPITDEHPHPAKVSWAESARISLDYKEDRLWMQLDPDVWIWPPRARKIAIGFLDERRGDRLNKKYNALLSAWIQIIFATDQRNAEIEVSPYEAGDGIENPKFTLSSRTAFARRLIQ